MGVWTALLFGVLEGVTEWLPISSTGHLLLLRRFVDVPVRDAFFEIFSVLVQLGAIAAVLLLFWRRLLPVGTRETRRRVLRLWGCVLLATLPCAVLGFLLDDLLDAYLFRAEVVGVALIVYGVLFILLEKRRKRAPSVGQMEEISPKAATAVGCFQVLSLIPGTSRSGATVCGGMLMGLSRPSAAEFSFLLGIPTMLGASLLKTVKFFRAGETLSAAEGGALAIGMLSAFITSLLVIRALLCFVRRHTFTGFGIYRILLGAAVLFTLLFP